MDKINANNITGESRKTIASSRGAHNVNLDIHVDLDTHETSYKVANLNSKEEYDFDFDQVGKIAAVEQFNKWTR